MQTKRGGVDLKIRGFSPSKLKGRQPECVCAENASAGGGGGGGGEALIPARWPPRGFHSRPAGWSGAEARWAVGGARNGLRDGGGGVGGSRVLKPCGCLPPPRIKEKPPSKQKKKALSNQSALPHPMGGEVPPHGGEGMSASIAPLHPSLFGIERP